MPPQGGLHRLDRGREIVRPLDPWPYSEAGRFHRTISLLMVALAALILVVEGVRHHQPPEVGLLLGLMAASAVAARWLLRDLRAHPANFPTTPPPRASWLPALTDAGRAAAGPHRTEGRHDNRPLASAASRQSREPQDPNGPRRPRPMRRPYSHSIVPGGLDVMSRVTRFTCAISLIMREATLSSRS